MELTRQEIQDFGQSVWDYYHSSARDLPWRQAEPDGSFDPYKILVSEMMLQQTQTSRVIPKYVEFIKAFPTLDSLAKSDQAGVMRLWSGLGYNRRAKYLWQSAQAISKLSGFPDTPEQLSTLPGIGINTAAAIYAYAFNLPVSFIETNIRTVFIYHFFGGRTDVTDKEILNLVRQTLPTDQGSRLTHPTLVPVLVQSGSTEQNVPKYDAASTGLTKPKMDKKPAEFVAMQQSRLAGVGVREWYWALMDYGAMLKKTSGNHANKSKNYVKQSAFKGSKRQVRGRIIKALTNQALNKKQLGNICSDERLEGVLSDLEQEGLIRKVGNLYCL